MHPIGAGVYCKGLHGRQVECCIDPAGQAATNAITRAELVAILQMLQEVNIQACVIATDSKASIHMTQNQLVNPSKLAADIVVGSETGVCPTLRTGCV